MKTSAAVHYPAAVMPDPTVTITMSLKDARVLAAVVSSIGGEPAGPRGVMTRLGGALSLAGVTRAEIAYGNPRGSEACRNLYIHEVVA